jgi:hypothetical protein
MPEWIFSKIISGGQTGVDRAALDAALAIGIPCGGWCPKGRKAEDGPIDFCYPFAETDSSEYQERTEKTVIESDGTLILNIGPLSGGTAYTIKVAEKYKKPVLVVDLAAAASPADVLDWAKRHTIRILNVAGPRESKAPGIYRQTLTFLRSVLGTALRWER